MTASPPRTIRLRAAAAALALLATLPVAAQELVVRAVGGDFADVHAALIDAVAEQGIAPPTESDFGAMLARTAADLGHRPDFYADARLVSFCSTPIAARMAAESVHQLLYCPLAVAVYRLPAEPGTIYLSYRRNAPTPAGRAAEALLEKILARTMAQFDAPPPARR